MPYSFSLLVKLKAKVMKTDNKYQYSSAQGEVPSDHYEADAET